MIRWLLLLLPVLAPFQTPQVHFRAVADHAVVTPGQEFWVGFHFQIPPGWHIYWKNSGEAGLPTRFHIRYPRGVTPVDWAWPAPRMFQDPGGTVTFGYADEVLILHRVRVASNVTGDRLSLAVRARWLICREVCVPGTARDRLEVRVGPVARPIERDLFATYLLRVPQPLSRLRGWQVRSRWQRDPDDRLLLRIRVQPPPDTRLRGLTFYPDGPPDLVVDYRRLRTAKNTLTIPVRRLGAAHRAPDRPITGVLQISFASGTHFVTLEIPTPAAQDARGRTHQRR